MFHSVAAFNNSGFDVLGNYQNLIPYQNSILLNIVTCGLIFFGGIGFLVIREMWDKKSLSDFTTAGLLILTLLMFIGVSPGSTGGGIKTSTFFVLLQGIKTAATNKAEKAFYYAVPKDAFKKAAVITLLAISIILMGTYIITIMEPEIPLPDILFVAGSKEGLKNSGNG